MNKVRSYLIYNYCPVKLSLNGNNIKVFINLKIPNIKIQLFILMKYVTDELSYRYLRSEDELRQKNLPVDEIDEAISNYNKDIDLYYNNIKTK